MALKLGHFPKASTIGYYLQCTYLGREQICCASL